MEYVYTCTIEYYAAIKKSCCRTMFLQMWIEKEWYQNQLGVPMRNRDLWILLQTHYWFRVSGQKN